MIDHYEISEEINGAIDYWQENMPEDIKRLITLANHDLYFGPIYLDSDGEIVSCFDEYESQFNFKKACNEIGDWLNENIKDLVMIDLVEPDSEDDGESEEWQEIEVRIDDSARDICKALVGTELIKYI